MGNDKRQSVEYDVNQLQQVAASQLRWPDWLRLFWGLSWRQTLILLATVICSWIAGWIIGTAIGLIVALAGGDPVEAFKLPRQIFDGLVGLGIGIVFFTVWFRWILRGRYGTLRIALVRTNVPHTPDIQVTDAA